MTRNKSLRGTEHQKAYNVVPTHYNYSQGLREQYTAVFKSKGMTLFMIIFNLICWTVIGLVLGGLLSWIQ